MTTTQPRRLTGQPSTSMVVAGQPNTFAGQVRDEEIVYIDSSYFGTVPAEPKRVIDSWFRSLRDANHTQGIEDLTVAMGEPNLPFTWYSGSKPENSLTQVFKGDVQPTQSLSGAMRHTDSARSRDYFVQHLQRSGEPRPVMMSFGSNAYQSEPKAAVVRVSSEGVFLSRQDDLIRQGSPDGAEPGLRFDVSVTPKPLIKGGTYALMVSGASSRYGKRVETLRGLAADEEITVNETSVEDFRYFVNSVVPTQNAQLVVMDNGNLRAVWKNQEGSHLGLQFLGGQLVQYVVFRRGGPEGKVYRLVGESSLDEMRKSVEDWGLSSLMSA